MILKNSRNIWKSLKRFSSLYSVENVLNEENMKNTAAKFANMEPIRLQTHEPYKKAAVLIPLCVVNDKVSLLYTLRAPHMKTHRNQVSFPGGMLDVQDKSLEDTALRETREELGIERQSVQVWGSGKLIVTRADISVLPVIGQIKHPLSVDALNINRSEVGDVFAVTLEDLCNPKKNSYTQFRDGYSAPLFLGAPKKIWGLTALITNVFLKALLPPNAYLHRVRFVPPVSLSGKQYKYL